MSFESRANVRDFCFFLDKGGYIRYPDVKPTPLGGGIVGLFRGGKMQLSEQAAKRLKTIEGHVRGIQRMVDEGAYCIDIIRQIQATQAALNKVSQLVLEEHMHNCVITAVRGEDAEERERVLSEIAEVYEAATRV